MASDHENKCTFIHPTFKVEENKVPLFFGLYVIFCFATCDQMFDVFMKPQNEYNSPGWPLIMKISALLFLQLSKLKKIKCPYFFIRCHIMEI